MNGDVFIKVYLDEDVDVLIADLIRSQGFTAVTTTEAGRKGKSDPDQLEYAASRRFAILTHNRLDFEQLAQEYFDNGRIHYGVIVSAQRQPREIATRMLENLNNYTADEMINQILYI